MAEMNLLKATFIGRLGEVVGQSWKGKPVVKAAVFSKAPPTNAQTRSVRAFECLNRLSSALAKLCWPYLNLSDKKMLRHNAVARWLKPLVKDQQFEPANMLTVVPQGNAIEYLVLTLNKTSQTGKIVCKKQPSSLSDTAGKLIAVVFNQIGKVVFTGLEDFSDCSWNFSLSSEPGEVFSLLAFTAIQAKQGYTLGNFVYRRTPGMQYSLDEQITNDLWLDDRPIFVKTYTATTPTLTTTAQANIDLGKLDADLLLDYSVVVAPHPNDNYARSGIIISSTINDKNLQLIIGTIYHAAATKELKLAIQTNDPSRATRFSSAPLYITIRYVK